jgi:hypothetical protein
LNVNEVIKLIIGNLPKLQTFAKCYEEFKIQPYLNNNLPKSIVKHLTNLRISVHTLLIEKGKF